MKINENYYVNPEKIVSIENKIDHPVWTETHKWNEKKQKVIEKFIGTPIEHNLDDLPMFLNDEKELVWKPYITFTDTTGNRYTRYFETEDELDIVFSWFTSKWSFK